MALGSLDLVMTILLHSGILDRLQISLKDRIRATLVGPIWQPLRQPAGPARNSPLEPQLHRAVSRSRIALLQLSRTRDSARIVCIGKRKRIPRSTRPSVLSFAAADRRHPHAGCLPGVVLVFATFRSAGSTGLQHGRVLRQTACTIVLASERATVRQAGYLAWRPYRIPLGSRHPAADMRATASHREQSALSQGIPWLSSRSRS